MHMPCTCHAHATHVGMACMAWHVPHVHVHMHMHMHMHKHMHMQAVLASRGGPTYAAWRAFYEQQAGARAARQRDLEHDLVRAWTAYLATGGK